MMLLCLIALVFSGILTAHSLSGMKLLGCDAGSSCEVVAASRWSLVMGILPVSAFALSAYLAALVCIVSLYFEYDRLLRKILLLITAGIFFCSGWFIGLQAFKIKAWCPYCLLTHLCGLLLAVLAFLSSRDLGKRTLWRLSGAGVCIAIAFAFFQVLTLPAYRAQTGHASAVLPIPDPATSPLVGPADAPHPVALLYDYRCSHCHTLHGFLDQAVAHFGGEICFVLCPTPLSRQCNPYIPADGEDRFAGSCELSRLALGLWKSAPALFPAFDRWLFSDEGQTPWQPRSVESAEAKVRELTGGILPDNAWAQEYLSQTLELFGRTTAQGRSGIPRLVAGASWIIPESDTPEGFIKAVEDLLEN